MYQSDNQPEWAGQLFCDCYQNNTSKFYQEHSACDSCDVKHRQQKWLEDKFKEAEDDETHLFIEQKFDSFFKDLSLHPETKSNQCHKNKGGELTDCKFSREDLQILSDTKSADVLSVCTDKGSDIRDAKEIPELSEESKKVSSFWKRVDMRQKKVIRGLCGLSRDYFKRLIVEKKTASEIFSVWDSCLKEKFPLLYESSRLILLGHISDLCLSWKFPEKIKTWEFFKEDEKEEVIKHSTLFRSKRNKCSNSKIRKEILNSPIVRIGKLLYKSCVTLEESFWNQILERKKADIIDFKLFKEAHLKDINKIEDICDSGAVLN